MNIVCTIITKPIIEMARILGLSPSVTNNLVSVWQTESGKHIMPTIQVLQRYKELKREQLNDIALAIPTYTVVKGTSSKDSHASIVKNANGTMSIILHTFGEGYDGNSLSLWTYSRTITNRNRDLFLKGNYSPLSAYYFELYAARTAVENGRTEITDDDYKEAINLLTKMKQSHPEIFKPKNTGQRIDTTKSEQKTVYDELEEYRGEFESGNPINIPGQQATPTEPSNTKQEKQWARTAANSYEVSTQGDSRFSALRAKFKPGTIIDGIDVGDKTIEYVYQTVIKKSGKGRAPSIESKLYRPELKTKTEQEDFSYREGYLPLWQEWARQNPGLIEELREKSAGKVLTDKFANTRVSQARALAEILNSTSGNKEETTSNQTLISKVRDYFLGDEDLSEEDAKAFIDLMDKNKKPANVAASKPGFGIFNQGFFFSTKAEMGGALAKTNSNNSITIAKDVTVADFFNYILGLNNSQTSQQKQLVFKELEKLGYSFEALKSLIQTPEDVVKFLQYHEMSHVYNEDRNNYWEPEEIGSPNKNMLTPKKIGIEARATIDAWQRLLSDKQRIYDEYQHQQEELAKKQGFEERKKSAVRRSLGQGVLDGTEVVPVNPATPTKDKEQAKEELPEYVLDPNDIPEMSDPIQIEEDDPRVRLVTDFTIGELQLRVDNIARKFSDTVSELVDKLIEEEIENLGEASSEDEAFEIESRIASLKDPVNGRREAINRVKVGTIYKALKDAYIEMAETPEEVWTDSYGPEEGPILKDKYQKIADNFDALFEEACILVEQFENCRIALEDRYFNDGNTKEKVIDGTVKESEQEQQKKEEEFGDDTDGKRATGNDGWSFIIRFVDPKTTLSSKVRAIISDIIQVDENGNAVEDDLHERVYVRQDRVYATLLNKLSKTIVDADDFVTVDSEGNITGFPALEEIAVEYPWVHQVINKLMADPTVVSLFYSNFRQEFINYWMQADGKTFPLNQPIAREDTINTIIANYERGEILDKDSIYNQDMSFNKNHLSEGISLIDNLISLDVGSDSDREEFFNGLVKAMRMAGIPSKRESLEVLFNSKEGDGYVKLISIANHLKDIFSIVNNLPNGSHLVNNNKSLELYRAIADLIGDVSEISGSQSFRQGKDTRYSYSAPDFISDMIKRFKFNSKRESFLNEKYRKYEWFYNSKKGTWNNEWLRLIEEDEDVRDMLDVKEVISLKEDGQTYEYNQWTSGLIKKSFIYEFFSLGESEGSSKQFAWYNFPIFADSEVVKFIKFIRYTKDFKKKLLPLMSKVVYQELYRINLIAERQKLIKEGKIKEISTFDSKGGEFKFFPQLNSMMIEGKSFLDTIVELNDGTGVNNKKIDTLIQTAVSDIMKSEFHEFMRNSEPVIQMLIDKDIASTREGAIGKLEEYFWNSTFATSQIIQLTTVDLAFYNGADDFQKRYKEVYASGTKLNTNSKYGKKKQSAIYLVDDVVTSATYSSVQDGLEQAVKSGRILDIDRDNILHKFRNITATDAQAFRTLPSFRSVLDMLGLWSEDMETALNHFENNEWDMADFNVVWQTIKPFVYTILDKPNGIGGRMPVPHQNKNSEFLLLAAYQLIGGVATKSPMIRGLNRAMIDNNIDVAEYQSAVKVGCQGAIDISYSRDKLNKVVSNRAVTIEIGDEHKTYSIPGSVTKFRTGKSDKPGIKEFFDSLLHRKAITQGEYNRILESFRPSEDEVYKIVTDAVRNGKHLIDDGNGGKYNEEVVHQAPTDSYIVQQPTPEHLFDTIAVFGSQFRNLIISDMDDNIEITIGTGENAITLKGKEAVQSMYQNLIVENLLSDYEKVSGKFANIHTLHDALMDTVRGNPKYGRDMIEALKIVKHVVNGAEVETFNIPLHSSTITNKVQELVNAMFKNAVTKQTIHGGNCILVSDVGYTDKLHIAYDKDGKLLGAECYMPFYTKKYFQPFLKAVKNGKGEIIGQEVDIEAIKKSDPELLRMIGYRIPTENKYSMLPLIIKGFLPQQNGSSIMLPADVTQLAGSDFDVDKLFLMIPEFEVEQYDIARAKRDFAEDKNINTLLHAISGDPDYEEAEAGAWKEWWKENKKKYKYNKPKIKKIRYDDKKSIRENSRAQRNNRIIDIAFGILTDPTTREKFNNPGNFDKAKKEAKRSFIIRNIEVMHAYMREKGIESILEAGEALMKESQESLEDFVKRFKAGRNPLSLDTFIYYHGQNMAGAALIGIYANNTTMQAKFQNSHLNIKDEFTFTINGRKIKSLHDTYIDFGNGKKELISANCANFSAASVDNAKDPVLADLMQNPNTAKVAGFMLRAGMTIEEIGLFFSQPVIAECIQSTGSLKELSQYIGGLRESLSKLGVHVKNETSLKKDYSSKFLLNNILLYNEAQHIYERTGDIYGTLPEFVPSVDGVSISVILENNLRAAILFKHIVEMANDLNDITQVSRADSPNGAMGRSQAIVKMQLKKLESMRFKALNDPTYPFSGAAELLIPSLISPDMSIDEMRERLNSNPIHMLQAFYSLGIELPSKILSDWFVQASPYMDSLVDKLYDELAPYEWKQKTVEKFYYESIQYALTRTALFGDDSTDTLEKKRDYYLYDFPKRFMREILKDEYKDIKSLDALRKLSISTSGVLEMYKSARTTAIMRSFLSSDFDKLISIKTKAARDLARDLFMYSFYDNGLGFGANNFSTLFSTFFVTKFPEYINFLRDMNFTDEESIFAGFYEQFCVNHPNIFPEIKDDRYLPVGDQPDAVYIEDKYVKNLKGVPRTYIRIYNREKQGFELYIRDSSIDMEKATVYRKIDAYIDPSGNGRVKYNASKDASQLKDSVDASRVAASKNIPTKYIEEAERQNEEEQFLNELDNIDFDDLDEYDLDSAFSEDQDFDEFSSKEGLDEINENPCGITIKK